MPAAPAPRLPRACRSLTRGRLLTAERALLCVLQTLLLLQADIETRMLAVAELHARSKDVQVVLLCDRGVLDGKAFCEDGEWEKVSASAGLSEADMVARYDMVCHLVTAAKGAAEHYEYGAGSRNPSRFHVRRHTQSLPASCAAARPLVC